MYFPYFTVLCEKYWQILDYRADRREPHLDMLEEKSHQKSLIICEREKELNTYIHSAFKRYQPLEAIGKIMLNFPLAQYS